MNVGDSRELHVPITRQAVVRYSGASTDFNEIHFSDRKAKALGLPGVLAHGMWTMGAGLRVVTDWIGDPGLVTSYQVRFTKPVVVPDTDEGAEVRYTASVESITDGLITFVLTATCGEDQVLGAAKVRARVADEEAER